MIDFFDPDKVRAEIKDKATISELADHIGVTRASVYNFVKGESDPSASTYIKIVKYLNALIITLKEGDEVEHRETGERFTLISFEFGGFVKVRDKTGHESFYLHTQIRGVK